MLRTETEIALAEQCKIFSDENRRLRDLIQSMHRHYNPDLGNEFDIDAALDDNDGGMPA